MNAKLINSVKRALGSNWRDYCKDIARYGVDGGFPGFTYYSDTVKFFKNNRSEIVALVREMAGEFGQNPIEFVQSFRCLHGNYNDFEGEAEISRALYGNVKRDDTQIPNALAWFAAEEVARHLTD